MSRIKGRDTAPERRVRSLLHRLGFRFSLRRKDLPGRPDIVLPRRNVAVFVHGCFWHRHSGCGNSVLPKTRAAFWLAKLNENVERDIRNASALKALGWKVLTIWECEVGNEARLSKKLLKSMPREGMPDRRPIPVIDLFAGPGGLGEGFSAFSSGNGSRAFRIALSIEMEEWAHQTLELRSFFRQFPAGKAPTEYYDHLRGELTRSELFAGFPDEAEAAAHEAWRAELGVAQPSDVDRRIRDALGPEGPWILCGGPPCQAFSVVGRSRNGGIAEDDHRIYLYKQYLRILSVHEPPVFIMENVKGLLSSAVKGSEIFDQMLEDLRHPAKVIRGAQRAGAKYALHSLFLKPTDCSADGHARCKPGDFVVKCEDYGIPQSRHRVIILGIREDIVLPEIPLLGAWDKAIPAKEVLRGLPRLRSGLTRSADGKTEWRAAVAAILDAGFMKCRRDAAEADLRGHIARTVHNLRDMQADRGGEFVSHEATCDYDPEWFVDPLIGGVCNHSSRPHMVSDLHRYLFAACYARVRFRSPELNDFPPELHPDHKSLQNALSKGHFDDRFRVQMAYRPATTITSHIAKDGHYFIHYDETQCRSLTVREAARLQTFPDNYYFCGPRTHQYRQVGNAVPPLLARQIAAIVLGILKGGRKERSHALVEEVVFSA